MIERKKKEEKKKRFQETGVARPAKLSVGTRGIQHCRRRREFVSHLRSSPSHRHHRRRRENKVGRRTNANRSSSVRRPLRRIFNDPHKYTGRNESMDVLDGLSEQMYPYGVLWAPFSLGERASSLHRKHNGERTGFLADRALGALLANAYWNSAGAFAFLYPLQ